MQIKYAIIAVLSAMLAACSVGKPDCSGGALVCQYEWYLYEADRLPPNYTRSRALLLLDPDIEVLPRLFENTASGKSQTLAMSYLLVDLHRQHGRSVCSRPQLRQMVSTVYNRTKWQQGTRSIERNLAKLDCPTIN